jgi:hypothetical protein
MNDELKFYSISFAGFFQYFIEILNPVMSFLLLLITILYTYQKYLNAKNNTK